MNVYVITEIDHLPSKETLTAKCQGGAEVSISGWVSQRCNTYIVAVVATEEEARQAIENRKKELIARHGDSVLEEVTKFKFVRQHRFFTFGVATYELNMKE